MMKKILVFLAFSLFGANALAQQTFDFAVRGSDTLRLDIYRPEGPDNGICAVYVFGGGFVMGSRAQADNVAFYKELTGRGFTVAAIDYRLGLKGVKGVGALNSKPVFEAVKLATQDLISATQFLVTNSSKLGIDAQKIAYIGSSAGAITVLQASYEISRRSDMVSGLPIEFKPSAVVSMSGALFSTQGWPKYGATAPPTALFHGTKDDVVVYKKIKIFNLGMFGTDALVKIFNKNNFAYLAVRYEGSKHEVAEFPRIYIPQQISDFIVDASAGKFDNQVDITVKDRHVKEKFFLNITRKSLYDGN